MLKRSLFLITMIFGLALSAQVADGYLGMAIPMEPTNAKITKLIKQLGSDTIIDNKPISDKNKMKIYRQLGVAFWDIQNYEAAEYYLSMSSGYSEPEKEDPKIDTSTKEELSKSELEDLKTDQSFIDKIPQTFVNVSKENMEKVAKMIDNQIEKLIKQRNELLKNNANKKIIEAKENSIKSLTKEKEIITLHVEQETLKEEKAKYKRYLIWSFLGISLLILAIVVLIQKKTIKNQDEEIEQQLKDINQKNAYLEHAAKIIRHDMHSGINTYIPRGLTSLEKRLTPQDIEKLKIEAPMKMIKEGLSHTQKVYKSVYEFTNLVKQKVVFQKTMVNLKELINTNLENTSYANQVKVDDLITIEANETLFWNALDNLIRNGLKYNDSQEKLVHIFIENGNIVIQDNGIGMTSNQFDKITKQFSNKEEASGLGLSICAAIFKEHGYSMSCTKLDKGTKITININKQK